MGFLLGKRPMLDATILRTAGMTYVEKEDQILNLYTYKVLNKSGDPHELEIKLLSPEGGEIEFIGHPNMTIEVSKLAEGSFFIKLDKDAVTGSQTEVEIGIYAEGELVETVSSNFNGPRKRTK
jgi:hypothetical protein